MERVALFSLCIASSVISSEPVLFFVNVNTGFGSPQVIWSLLLTDVLFKPCVRLEGRTDGGGE